MPETWSFGGTTWSPTLSAQRGYKTTAHMALDMQKNAKQEPFFYDNTSKYDWRECELSYLMPKTEAQSMWQFFNSYEYGRGNTITLTLDSACKFFPAGPDKGNAGIFTCRLASPIKDQAPLMNPWGYFPVSLHIAFKTCPSYSIPTQVNYGDFYIGNIYYLPEPQEQIQYEPAYGYKVALTYSGDAANIDLGTEVDKFNSIIEIPAEHTGAALIFDYITRITRGGYLYIKSSGLCLPFGIPGSLTSYLYGKLNDNKITCIHSNTNTFNISIPINGFYTAA